MVGKELKEKFSSRNNNIGDTLLEVKNLNGNGLKDISFKVRKGEVFGIAGLVGAKRTELVRMIFGADPYHSGTILIEGKETKIKSPKDAVSKGIGLVPEDRKNQGVLLNLSVKWNISMPIIKKFPNYWL
jgi:ABC-type sugar transport system, ATPase component